MTRVHARVLGRLMRSDGEIWISQGNVPVLRRHKDHHAHARFRTSDLFIKASNACGLRQRSNGRVMFERSNGRNQIWKREGPRWVFFFLVKNNNNTCLANFENPQILTKSCEIKLYPARFFMLVMNPSLVFPESVSHLRYVEIKFEWDFEKSQIKKIRVRLMIEKGSWCDLMMNGVEKR
jgi:hypothetical protein